MPTIPDLPTAFSPVTAAALKRRSGQPRAIWSGEIARCLAADRSGDTARRFTATHRAPELAAKLETAERNEP